MVLCPLSLGHCRRHSLTWPQMAAGGCPQARQPVPVKHHHPAKAGHVAGTAGHQQHGSPAGCTANTTHASGDPTPGSPSCAIHLVQDLCYTFESGRNLLWQVRSIESWSQSLSLCPLGVGKEKQAVIH